jgi:hypothetical protein
VYIFRYIFFLLLLVVPSLIFGADNKGFYGGDIILLLVIYAGVTTLFRVPLKFVAIFFVLLVFFSWIV